MSRTPFATAGSKPDPAAEGPVAQTRARWHVHLPHLLFALLIYAVVFLGTTALYQNWDLLFTQDSDLLVHIPRALKLNDPALYARDPAFGAFDLRGGEMLHQALFPWILSRLIPTFGIKGTLIALALLLGTTFVIGTYALGWTVTHDHLASVLAAAFGAFVYEGLSPVTLGFNPPQVLPRNLVVACAPWLVLGFLRRRETWRLPLVFLGIGLCANLHATAALHLCGLLGLTYLSTTKPSWEMARRLSLGALATVAGAIPTLLYTLSRRAVAVTDLAGATTAQSASVVESRLAFAVVPSTFRLLLFGVPALAFVAASLLGFRRLGQRRIHHAGRLRPYIVLYGLVGLIPWLGVLVNTLTLRFWRLEPMRISRYLFALSFAPIGALLSGWLASRRPRAKLQALMTLLLLLTISRPELWYIGWLRRAASSAQEPAPVAFSLDDLRDVGAWARSHTDIDALFLAPVDWAAFYVYGQRSLVIAEKVIWAAPDRYDVVKEAYGGGGSVLATTASAYDADYLITGAGAIVPGFEAVYANPTYRVWRPVGAPDRR